jgi:CheY-like chemotaxis protein
MDLNMPDFDALKVTERIRTTGNPNVIIIISALSAHAYRDYISLI